MIAVEALSWLAVAWGAYSGARGNRAAWPLVASACVAAGFDWGGVEFTPLRWTALDLAAIAGIVGLRWRERAKRAHVHVLKAHHGSHLLHWTDWLILALFLPAWGLYLLADPYRYLGVSLIVGAQFALTTRNTAG